MKSLKGYTDIKQSKILKDILPIESADMVMWGKDLDAIMATDAQKLMKGLKDRKMNYIPCWSLAALLDVLPQKYYPIKDHETNLILGKPKDKWCALYWDAMGVQDGEQTLGDSPVDACVEMILKLHEQKIL